MSSPPDLSIRPTPPTDPTTLARVTDREDHRKHGDQRQADRKPRPHEQPKDHPPAEASRTGQGGDGGGTIDLLA